MELEITFRNIESTEAIKDWANKRFRKVLKHLREPSSAQLTVTVDKHRHRAELTVHTAGGILRATDETGDMYATLDAVMATIEESAQRAKERSRE
jgi:putative sigma-54 modulation protein